MDRWRGKTAVVTGAGSGIGAGVALGLANAGLHVVGLDLKADLVQNLKSKVEGRGTITGRCCDVSNPEVIDTTFKWIEDYHDGVHVLVNCAGVLYSGQITDVGSSARSVEELSKTIDVNFKGTVLCARRAINSMKIRGFDGHIININSIAGHYIPNAVTFNVYSATKYAITAFTETLNRELAEFKSRIKITSLSPGLVQTNMAADLKALNLPALQPKDLADAVLYVLSTPPNVNISELKITSVMEKLL